jgi:hypothetical protein
MTDQSQKEFYDQFDKVHKKVGIKFVKAWNLPIEPIKTIEMPEIPELVLTEPAIPTKRYDRHLNKDLYCERSRNFYNKNKPVILARLQKKYAVNQDYKEATKARALARYYRLKTFKTILEEPLENKDIQ